MSHELRTPLNSLLILAEQLDDNPDHNMTDTQVEYASVIHRVGQRPARACSTASSTSPRSSREP